MYVSISVHRRNAGEEGGGGGLVSKVRVHRALYQKYPAHPRYLSANQRLSPAADGAPCRPPLRIPFLALSPMGPNFAREVTH